MQKNLKKSLSSIEEYSVELTTVQCQNSRNLTADEVEELVTRMDWSEDEATGDWRFCDNPSCNELCKPICAGSPGTSHALRGDNPSCICACFS
jgi:hypothetical protein